MDKEKKEKAKPRRAKKWSKIWLLNWVTIIAFFICLTVIFVDHFLGNISQFSIADIDTWDIQHIIVIVTGGYLLLESVALLRTKKVDLVKALDDIDKDKKKGGS